MECEIMAKAEKAMEEARRQQDTILSIREQFPDVPWKNVSQETLALARSGELATGYIGNVVWEDDVPEVVAVVSKDYNFIPFEVITAKFIEEVNNYPQYGKAKILPQVIKGGRRFSIKASFPKIKKEVKAKKNGKLKVGDKISPTLGVRSSIDLGWSWANWAGAEVLRCLNGMVGYELEKNTKKKHKQNLFWEDELKTLGDYVQGFDMQLDVWNSWTEKMLKKEEAEKIIEILPFSTKQTEEILCLPEAGTQETVEQWLEKDAINMWSLYNIYTQFLTHNVESDVVRVEKSQEVARRFHNLMN